MGYSNKPLLTDLDNKPIPQEFDPVSDSYQPLTNMNLYGKSTDIKPIINVKIGTAFLEIDTQTIYIFDGTTWVVF